MTTPEEQLAALRAQIDATDQTIGELLISRVGIIHQVAALKAANWPNNCHIRPGREGQMHQKIAQRFNGTAFPPLAALAIWRQLIGASTHLESPLNITTLDAHPEHLWLAREYFGVQIGLEPAFSMVDALSHMRMGSSNILILPCPQTNEWWKAAEAMRAAGLFIFASLPVVGNNLPNGTLSAVALAKVAPEPSGDDVSYHVTNGILNIYSDFNDDAGEGIFLGAHPRAISLGA
jgi:chorismate mutase